MLYSPYNFRNQAKCLISIAKKLKEANLVIPSLAYGNLVNASITKLSYKTVTHPSKINCCRV